MRGDTLPAMPTITSCPAHEGSFGSPAARQTWRLKKHHSLSPKQYAFASLLLCIAPLFAAGFVHACTGSLSCYGFAALNLGIIWGAYLSYAIHADDGELLELKGHELVITRVCGRTMDTVHVNIRWASIAFPASGTGPIKIMHCGKSITLGKDVSLARRRIFAAELAAALRSS